MPDNPISCRFVELASNTPPGSPVSNGYYIVLASPTGAWSGNASKIAYYTGTAWEFITPNAQCLLYTKDTITLYQYNLGTAAWQIPTASSGALSGITKRIAIWNSTTSITNSSILTENSSKILLSTTVSDNPSALFQINADPSDAGGYSFSNWNSTSLTVPEAIVLPSNNGGSSPATFFPGLIIARPGVFAQAYANFVEFKIGRWEASGVSSRSGLRIAMVHDVPGYGTDVAGFFSDARVETYGTVLRLNATAASSAATVNIQVGNDTNRPALRWNHSTAKWQFSNDGTSFTDIGAGGGGSLPVSDATSIVEGSVDPTKELRFEVDGFTTGTIRVATWPNEDITVTGIATAQTLTNKTWGSGTKVSIGSDATGDIWYRDSSGNFTRLAIGTSGQILTVSGGLPSWSSSGAGVTGSGTAKRLAIWTSASALGNSVWREDTTNSRTAYNPDADPDSTYPRAAINGLPTGNGSTINWANWNSTSVVVPFLIRGGTTNGGSSMIAPTPLLVMGLDGVSGQSFGSDAALAMNRYSTASNQSLTRLVIQCNVASSEYPVDTMSFYGNGRAGLNNGATSTSGNYARGMLHIGNQFVNAGTNFMSGSTDAWNSQGTVPIIAVWSDQDATSGQTHPPLIIAKKGVAAGQQAQIAEFGLGRYESATNAPRTRLDFRLAHATNETRSVRIASMYSYGGFALAMTDGVDPTLNNADAILQIGDTPINNGSFSVSNWNSTSQRLRAFFVTPTNNGGSSPSAYEPGLVLCRAGVTSQAFTNYVEFKVGRWENNGTNARSALTIATTHAGGDAAGTDIIEFRSDKSTNFKGQAGSPRNTQTGSGAQTVDWNLGNTFEQTASGAVTLTFSNGKAGSTYTLMLKQNGTGGFGWTFPAAMKWAGASAPTFTTAANAIDIIEMYYDGTNYYETSRTLNLG